MILERGEVHIKYGHILGDPYYVIKAALRNAFFWMRDILPMFAPLWQEP